jgi:hypothetical protein
VVAENRYRTHWPQNSALPKKTISQHSSHGLEPVDQTSKHTLVLTGHVIPWHLDQMKTRRAAKSRYG